MKRFDEYLKAKADVLAHFGYVTDWVEIPLEDHREYYWYLNGDGYGGEVCYANKPEELPEGCNGDDGEYFAAAIYTQRFLKQWVYRADDYTLICMDTQVDGNKFLGVFDNTKERPDG